MATIKENAKILEILTSLSKQRGFIFQSSEIYGGLGSTWDWFGTDLGSVWDRLCITL